MEETSRGDGCVYGINCSDSFTGIYLFPNASSCTYELCKAFTCQSYLKKWLKKKKGVIARVSIQYLTHPLIDNTVNAVKILFKKQFEGTGEHPKARDTEENLTFEGSEASRVK